MVSPTPLLDTLSQHLPAAISSELSILTSPQSRSIVETLLSFALGEDCPTRLLDVARQDWSRDQPAALTALRDVLKPKGGAKRTRDSQDTDDATSKRPKTLQDNANDPPLFTLPSISTTSPVRKKVDVTVHAHSVRFTNPSTRALEYSVPLASIARAFLVPTRGKSKGHWTVILLPSDVPDKAKALPASAQQIIFGLDALSAATFETRSYASPSDPTTSNATTTIAKGEETVASVRRFLSYIPVPLLEPSATVFRSACATAKAGEGAAGIDAYLSAKSGTLWFFDTGILWGESKPCEFWAVSDMAAKDGVRLISATGRTCSVTLSRKSGVSANGSGGTADEDEDGEGIVETVFSMVDGREQDPISAWARNRKHLFGKIHAVDRALLGYTARKNSHGSGSGKVAGPQQPNGTVKGPAWDDSDPEDEDFEVPSSEDLEQSSSDSDQSESGNGSESAEESGDEPEEEEELQEARHPLLRPGAMPRMSKAAIDMVVDMVNDDLMGDASEEEDELDE